ncbi:Emopamil-binding protein, partial [Pseudohyphozyma bogoriensis]
VVLSTAEIYGGWLTFCPEWLIGSPALNPLNSPLHLWVHLAFMNLIWVFIPLWLMWDSWTAISEALREVDAREKKTVARKRK